MFDEFKKNAMLDDGQTQNDIEEDIAEEDLSEEENSDNEEHNVVGKAYPVHIAAYDDDCPKISRLWSDFESESKDGDGYDVTDKRGFTVLHEAVYGGSVDVVRLLLSKGVDINATTIESEGYESDDDSDSDEETLKIGSTALHIAVNKGNMVIAKILIEHRASNEIKDNRGYTPLMKAIKEGQMKIAFVILDSLSDYDFFESINHDDYTHWGQTRLGYYIRHNEPLEYHGVKEQDRISKKVVYKLWEPAWTLKINGSPILHHIYHDDPQLVINILRKRIKSNTLDYAIDLNATDKKRKTLLHYAVEKEDKDLVEFLSDFPNMVNPEQQDESGETPLMIAIKKQNIGMIELLRKSFTFSHVFKKIPIKRVCRKVKEEMVDDYEGWGDHLDDIFQNADPNDPEFKEYKRNYVNDIMSDDSRMPTEEDFNNKKVKKILQEEDIHIDDPCEDLGDDRNYLQLAIEQDDPEVLREILKFDSLELDDVGNMGRKCRAISLQMEKLQRNEIKVYLEIIKNLSAPFHGTGGYKTLERELKKYSYEDLLKIKYLSSNGISNKPFIEFLVNFHGEKGKGITLDKFVECLNKELYVKNELQKDKKSSENVVTEDVLKLLMLMAAHKELTMIPTNGDSDSEEEEDALAEKALERLSDLHDDSSLLVERSNNSNEPCVVLWRGINFMRDRFVYRHESRDYVENKAHSKKIFYSSACTYLYKEDACEDEVPPKSLENNAELLDAKIRKSKLSDIDENNRIQSWSNTSTTTFPSLRYLIQQFYTMLKDKFDQGMLSYLKLKCKSLYERIIAIDPAFENIFTKNPFVSASGLPDHAVRYAIGMSRGNSNIYLIPNPRYKNGKPKCPTVGIVFCSLYPKSQYEAVRPINVPMETYNGNMKIGVTLLNEFEITFIGKMENIVDSISIVYPSFEKPYEQSYAARFGFDEAKYNKFRRDLVCILSYHEEDPKLIPIDIGQYKFVYYSNKYSLVYKDTKGKRQENELNNDKYQEIIDHLKNRKNGQIIEGRLKKIMLEKMKHVIGLASVRESAEQSKVLSKLREDIRKHYSRVLIDRAKQVAEKNGIKSVIEWPDGSFREDFDKLEPNDIKEAASFSEDKKKKTKEKKTKDKEKKTKDKKKKTKEKKNGFKRKPEKENRVNTKREEAVPLKRLKPQANIESQDQQMQDEMPISTNVLPNTVTLSPSTSSTILCQHTLFQPSPKHLTAAGGNCAFHAVLAEGLNADGDYECVNVARRRIEVANAVRGCKVGDRIFELVRESIKHVIQDNEFRPNENGRDTNLRNLKRLYDQWKIDQELRFNRYREEFIQKLLETTDVILYLNNKYSELNSLWPNGIGTSLKDKFEYVRSKDENLIAHIKNVPELHRLYVIFDKVSNEHFDWDSLIRKEDINEYATLRIEPLGEDLLRHEIGIIAYACNITVILSATGANDTETYNPEQNRLVRANFNGINHFEREESVSQQSPRLFTLYK